MTRGLRSRPASGAAGFTLIEILVVLAILGLSLAIVAGFLPRGNTGLTLATSADQIANMLRLARANAIATQEPVVFAVGRDGQSFVLDRSVHRLPEPVRMALADTTAIRFAPDGSSSGGTIRLQAGSSARTLRVDWLTGRVVVANAR